MENLARRLSLLSSVTLRKMLMDAMTKNMLFQGQLAAMSMALGTALWEKPEGEREIVVDPAKVKLLMDQYSVTTEVVPNLVDPDHPLMKWRLQTQEELDAERAAGKSVAEPLGGGAGTGSGDGVAPSGDGNTSSDAGTAGDPLPSGSGGDNSRPN